MSHCRGVDREALREIVLRHRERRRDLAARAGVSERTLQRVLYGERSGNGGRRYKGALVDLDVADRICIALGEQLP